jgi:hypothetical protein
MCCLHYKELQYKGWSRKWWSSRPTVGNQYPLLVYVRQRWSLPRQTKQCVVRGCNSWQSSNTWLADLWVHQRLLKCTGQPKLLQNQYSDVFDGIDCLSVIQDLVAWWHCIHAARKAPVAMTPWLKQELDRSVQCTICQTHRPILSNVWWPQAVNYLGKFVPNMSAKT